MIALLALKAAMFWAWVATIPLLFLCCGVLSLFAEPGTGTPSHSPSHPSPRHCSPSHKLHHHC